LQLAGFHVTGVDIEKQPRYCGDRFFCADALEFPLDGYDFIWASPPCQAFTALRALQKGKYYPDLIPATRLRLAAQPALYCIENVEGAPLGASGYLIMLCGTMFGLGTPSGSAELRRHRLFETSFSIPLRPACQHGTGMISIHGDHSRARRIGTITVVGAKGMPGLSHARQAKRVITVTGHTPVVPRSQRRTISVTGSTAQTNLIHNRSRATYSVDEARFAMGIDWMGMKELSQAIPPAYAEFIGKQAIHILQRRATPGRDETEQTRVD
jgi:DNA (cytosine-5)-methyltransferase 1